jgi:hypothetical protein
MFLVTVSNEYYSLTHWLVGDWSMVFTMILLSLYA